MRAVLAAAMLLTIPGTVPAGEHPACLDIDYPYRELAPEDLRSIARTCARQPLSDLYYHRAAHAELVAEHAAMSSLEQVRSDRHDWTPGEDRLFLNLVEIVSAQSDIPETERARVLNTALDHAIEVAEFRLMGYDRLARRLEATGLRRNAVSAGDPGKP